MDFVNTLVEAQRIEMKSVQQENIILLYKCTVGMNLNVQQERIL